MNIFNSLGSNYDFNFALKSLVASNKTGYSSNLVKFLENKYQGKATLLRSNNVSLLYKGRQALELGLKSLNLPQGNFVAINGFTCFAVYEAIRNANLNVEYLDIEKGGLNFSPKTLEKSIARNPQIKVVIIQNTLGYPCDIEQIAQICQQNNLILIEDLAHSIGTRYKNGEETGSVGDLVVLSFSQDKIIDGISGGALINEGVKLAHLQGVHLKKQIIDRFYPFFTYLIRITYPWGLGKTLHFLFKSLKLLSEPMDQIGDGMHQLPAWYCNLVNLAFKNLQDNLDHRRNIAAIYAKSINPKITSPKIISSINISSNLRFPIFVNNRQNLIRFLKNHQVYVSDIWYDAPIAPKEYLPATDYHNQCPNSELASSEILNLPTHRNVSEKDAQNLAQLINQWLKSQ